jgi:branched-chain amino acid transport system ATP-binding protein
LSRGAKAARLNSARPRENPRPWSSWARGLAPLLRLQIWQCLARLKAEGQAILIVDKHLGALVKLADRHAIIEKGQVVWRGTSAALTADATVAQRYLQV